MHSPQEIQAPHDLSQRGVGPIDIRARHDELHVSMRTGDDRGSVEESSVVLHGIEPPNQAYQDRLWPKTQLNSERGASFAVRPKDTCVDAVGNQNPPLRTV